MTTRKRTTSSTEDGGGIECLWYTPWLCTPCTYPDCKSYIGVEATVEEKIYNQLTLFEL